MADQASRRERPAPEVGARVRAAHVDAGLSLRALARQLGVSASLLSQVERGLAQPSVATLWALVRELDLSLDALFAGPGGGPPESRPAIVQRAAKRPSIKLGAASSGSA